MSPIEKAARALLSDIEAMAQGAESSAYGEFEFSPSGEYSAFAIIDWPNLAISAAKLRAAVAAIDDERLARSMY